jgi:hypothetical protein
LERAERDALVSVLEPMQRGWRQTEPPRKFRIRHFTAAFTQKSAKLTFRASRPPAERAQWVIPDVE